MEYCFVAKWSPPYKKDKDLLERVQHRLATVIPGFSSMTYDDMMIDYAILGYVGLWVMNRADLVEVFKMWWGLSRNRKPFDRVLVLLKARWSEVFVWRIGGIGGRESDDGRCEWGRKGPIEGRVRISVVLSHRYRRGWILSHTGSLYDPRVYSSDPSSAISRVTQYIT